MTPVLEYDESGQRWSSSSSTASLGCGTLILIALIVMMFGNRGNDELKRSVNEANDQLRRQSSQIRSLERKIDALREELKERK